MNEVEFRNWLTKKNVKLKVVGDTISRLKRVEREIKNCDIDEQYRIDKCDHLLKLFLNMGNNNEMKMYPNAQFPIGKYYMSTYRLALKQYIQFLDDVTSKNL
ncbi:hypothetical protein ACLSZ5_06025 [Avibacterium avium]|uniref:Uncharacterized protein n=1 Tax=Avibacterium gallinarum TaxID=755 RepID=A0A379AXR5_AVIGA|nr:hypothetical protein [Avibacterium gallinarum]POY44711.1 hypothetical protein C3007_05235 [Avibacterium gallinarum]TDP30508.1 hypothetical protein EV689_101544 [Avibacterium gallinarum]SUB27008.1 Uncharacterised protein [Avibacterium gallinarum]